MDNLPSDPSNPNSNNNSTPPPFGSGFTPHTNPIGPNNPYQTQPLPNPVPPPPQTPPLNTPASPTHQGEPNTSNIPDAPENPDALKHEHYSEVAQNKPRDDYGHFIHPQASQIPPQSLFPSSHN